MKTFRVEYCPMDLYQNQAVYFARYSGAEPGKRYKICSAYDRRNPTIKEVDWEKYIEEDHYLIEVTEDGQVLHIGQGRITD